MTRFAVVGHVEWIEFGRFSHVPEPGEIIDANEWFSEAAGSAAVAAVQLAKLSGEVDLFTALGNDERGPRSRDRLEELGVRVHAARREGIQYGAGDTFAGGVNYALGAGYEIEDALSFAARAGAANLTAHGPYAGQLTAADLDDACGAALLTGHRDPAGGR